MGQIFILSAPLSPCVSYTLSRCLAPEMNWLLLQAGAQLGTAQNAHQADHEGELDRIRVSHKRGRRGQRDGGRKMGGHPLHPATTAFPTVLFSEPTSA